MVGPPYGCVRHNSRSWRALIRIDGIKHWLGHWATPEEAACAYEYTAIRTYGDNAVVNFFEDREYVEVLKPEGIWIATIAEKREYR